MKLFVQLIYANKKDKEKEKIYLRVSKEETPVGE
jgi:hypothetical protein